MSTAAPARSRMWHDETDGGNKTTRSFLVFGGLAVTFIFCACGSSGSGSGPTTSGDAGSSGNDGGDSGNGGGVTTSHVSAANGGTVSDPSGTFVLTVPPGALARDTDITVSVGAKYAEALTSVGTFGPDGLTFSTPATLAIRADASLAPAGGTLAVGLATTGSFAAVAGSTAAAGKVTAPIAHFSSYAVIAAGGGTDKKCGFKRHIIIHAEQDPSVTKMTFAGSDLYVPGLYKDGVLDTTCNPPQTFNHVSGLGSAEVPYCLGTCAATGNQVVVSSEGVVGKVVYSSNACGGFNTPPEDFNVPAGLIPGSPGQTCP